MKLDCDYNSTTPIKPSVYSAMKPYLKLHYGNPSSQHRYGQQTRSAVEKHRSSIASYLGVSCEQVIFTASGSEANSLALRGRIRPPYREKTILASPGEHPSILAALRWFEKQGAVVKLAPFAADCRPDLNWFEENINSKVDFVSVMAVNNETGLIYPAREIGELCRKSGVDFHSDAAQALGKQEIVFSDMNANTVSFSGHKIGAPKGTGLLIISEKYQIQPLVFGHQEQHLRGGTENVAAIVGLGVAFKMLNPVDFEKIARLRDRFEERIQSELADLKVVGTDVQRVANTTAVFVPGAQSDELVIRLDRAGYAISTGSACLSGAAQYSAGVTELAGQIGCRPQNFIRVSFSPTLNKSDLDQFADVFIEAIHSLRSSSGERNSSL